MRPGEPELPRKARPFPQILVEAEHTQEEPELHKQAAAAGRERLGQRFQDATSSRDKRARQRNRMRSQFPMALQADSTRPAVPWAWNFRKRFNVKKTRFHRGSKGWATIGQIRLSPDLTWFPQILHF